MSLKAEIIRDDEGFPVLATVSQGSQSLKMTYDKGFGFTVDGSRRSLSNDDLWRALRLIYPGEEKVSFEIPQPLQVTQIQGGKTIMFDDMESLLKWDESGATVALDNTIAYSKTQSLKLTAAAGAIATAIRWIPLKNTVNYSCVWGVDDWTKITTIDFYLSLQLHVSVVTQHIQFNVANLVWRYQGPTGAYVDFPNGAVPVVYRKLDNVGGQWHSFSLKADMTNNKILGCTVDERFLGGDLVGYRSTGASAQNSYVALRIDAVAAQDCNAWFDDVLVTEE